MNINKVLKAIEDDAGEEIPGLKESLQEMTEGKVGREYTEDQLLAMAARKKAKQTQPGFAKCLQTPIGTYRDWEQGRHPLPGSTRVLMQLILIKPRAVVPALIRSHSGEIVSARRKHQTGRKVKRRLAAKKGAA